MSKKNTVLIKWMLVILVVLMAVAYWTTRQTQSKNQEIWPAASNVSSQNNFFQFLGYFIGMRNQNGPGLPATPPWRGSTLPTRGHVTEGNVSPGTLPAGTPLNVKATQGTGLIAGQGTNTIQEKNNAGNNTGNLSETNAENNPGNLTGNNAGNNSGNLSEANAENNPEDLSEMNSENNPGTTAENDSDYNPEDNSESPSSCVQGCYLGCDPGCDSECTPECLAGVSSSSISSTSSTSSTSNSSASSNSSNPSNPSNLPTINPIPSDAAVSQSVAQQNQQNSSLSTLVANQQTLATAIRQSAEATKYQTVTSESIAPANTTPASGDIVAKIKSHALTFR
jgi:hypothetical protein